MDHFKGTNQEERWKNDVLNELRLIRQSLEHNAQMVEPIKAIQPKPRGRQKRSG